MIREHAPELLVKDDDGETPLDIAKLNPYPTIVSFFTEAGTAFRAGNCPALIKLCGSTPAWKHEVKLTKDKNDKEETAEADR